MTIFECIRMKILVFFVKIARWFLGLFTREPKAQKWLKNQFIKN